MNLHLPERSSFKYTKQLSVQWGEMDALKHVNNVVYIRYFETARIEYFSQSGIWQAFVDEGIVVVLGKIECNFLRPLVFPDEIAVMARVKSIGNSSLVVEQAVYSQKLGLCACGDAVVVCTDPATGRKTNMPQHLKELIAKIEDIDLT
jgi:acyl-CoA thioester hydrolase